MNYDAVVVGLGAMGSAAVYQLAKSGAKVLGVDRYSPPHGLGSTHGDTRITRLAIGEGPEYVPLVTRSHEIWREIERGAGYPLLHQCGGLIMAAQTGQGMHGNDDFLRQTIVAAQRFDIPHETLTAEQISKRYPQFELVGSEVGYAEAAAGFLRPERCVETQLQLAREHGAVIRFGEQVLSYRDDGEAVTVSTDKETVTAGKIIIAAGPWISQLLPALGANFTVYRQVMFWFDLKDKSQHDAYARLPVYIWGFGRDRDDLVYGFPMIDGPDGGAKVAREEYRLATTPDDAIGEVTQDEIDVMYEHYVRDRLPGLSRTCVKATSCLYTVTPNSRCVIDFHPTERNVIVASPCSGHGFKHSAAIGEVLSQLVGSGKSEIDISSFGCPPLDSTALSGT